MPEKSPEHEHVLNAHRVREKLLDIFETYQDTFQKHQWPLEIHRWYELVRCVLSAVEGRFDPHNRATNTTKLLIDMELLDIPLLAKCSRDASEESASQVRSDIHTVLRRTGYDLDQANNIGTALCALARAVEDKCQARIQALLREQCVGLVGNILEQFPLDGAIGTKAARLAITHWLQNVLNLPILVDSPGLQAICKQMNANPSDVLEAADQLDINAALLDEILNRWFYAYPMQLGSIEGADE